MFLDKPQRGEMPIRQYPDEEMNPLTDDILTFAL